MKKNKNRGITLASLVITIIVLLIIAGISVYSGTDIIKRAKLEELKTNMLLIETKAKECVENANFKLGKTDNLGDTEKTTRINEAKKELKGIEITEADNIHIFNRLLYICLLISKKRKAEAGSAKDCSEKQKRSA